MNTLKVTTNPKVWRGEECKEMDRKFFKDMVYQAMFYPGNSLTIGNTTLSGTTLFIKRANQPALKKYAGWFDKVVTSLWAKAKRADSIVFRSKFEQVEYLIIHEN